MCNALKTLLQGKITQQAASQKFGPKVPTVQKYLRKVREMVEAGLSLDSALKALEFPPPGPRPLLNEDELDLLVAKADTREVKRIHETRRVYESDRRHS